MDQALIDFANQNGFDKHSVQSLADFIIDADGQVRDRRERG